MKPLVSILIPAFNSEKFIAETVKSALAQTWPRKEIIIVDDGSTDRTWEVARQFASSEVVVVTQPNQGASVARNHALFLSQGEFIQWLDADDLLAPDKVQKQMDGALCCGDKHTLFSSAWGSFFYRPDRTKFTPTPLWRDLSPIEWLVLKLDQNLFMQTGTWLVSRELTNAAGQWDTRLTYDDDGEYFARVIKASNGTRFVPEAKTLYRASGTGSLSHIGRSNRKLESLCLSMQLHVEHVWSLESSERVRAACLNYLRRNLIFFYPERPDLVNVVQELANTLGGELETPRLPWKYAGIQKLCGWNAAKNAQVLLPNFKSSLVRSLDRALHGLQKRSTHNSQAPA